MPQIRPASEQDISRIAEILIFAKRVAYRPIFQDDQVSFGEMQVLPLAQQYLSGRESLKGVFVYEDGFVRGLLHLLGEEILQLYVDPFFQHQGIGGALMAFAQGKGARRLWVLEKNQGAIRFYQAQGFDFTGRRKLEEGTPEYIQEMELARPPASPEPKTE